MSKSNIFIIDSGPYNTDIMVAVDATEGEITKELNKRGVYPTEKTIDKFIMRGTTAARTIELGGNQIIIRLKTDKELPWLHGNIAHEAFHAVEFIFDRIGIKHNLEISGEAFAYLIGYIVRQIYNNIKI